MDQYSIMRCRICGVLMRRYAHAVYPGDSSCCAECNRKSDPKRESKGD